MRNFCDLIFLAGALGIVGCGKEQSSEQPPAPAQSAPASGGGGGYLGTLAKGQQVAVKGIDTASLNQAVQLFNASEGRFPTNLDELVAKQYMAKLPDAPNGMKL